MGARAGHLSDRLAYRVGYVCKAVDEDHPTVSHHTGWIRALASRPEVSAVQVFTPGVGRADLPANVDVSAVAGEKWARRGLSFTRQVLGAPGKVDFFFIGQGGPWPALLLPWRGVRRGPVFQWKAHPHVSARMRAYARYCDTLIFTPTPSSFPYLPEKVRVVGHGIDTELFHPTAEASDGDLLVVGRVSPIKRLVELVQVLALVRAARGEAPTLDVIGPCLPHDRAYQAEVERTATDLGLREHVRFHGPMTRREVATQLPRHRMAVNFSATAFDKFVGEAMACGVPVLTTNACAREALPASLHHELAVPADDVDAQAKAVQAVLDWDDARRAAVGTELRAAIVAHHDLDSLFAKILAEAAPFVAAR